MAIASIRIGSMVLLVASVGGCAISNATVPLGAEQEKVKQVFVSFQKVLKDADAEKIWAILEADSQADAERKAETIRDIMATGSDAEKAEMERKLGLPGADLAAVKGVGFLKTKRFLGKYADVIDSKIEKIVVTGDRAVVSYIEEDGDRASFDLHRRGDDWKLSVPMPTAK